MDLLHRLQVKADQLNKASAEAISFIAKVKPETGELVAGKTTTVTVTAFNGGQVGLKNVALKLNVPKGWQATPLGATRFANLGYNQTVKASYQVMIPQNADLFLPYQQPAVSADISYEAFDSVATVHATSTDAVAVLPPFSLSLDPSATVLNTLNAGSTASG